MALQVVRSSFKDLASILIINVFGGGNDNVFFDRFGFTSSSTWMTFWYISGESKVRDNVVECGNSSSFVCIDF